MTVIMKGLETIPATDVMSRRKLKLSFFRKASRQFRTIQVCPKDFPAMPRQPEGAAPAKFSWEGLTMSERAIDDRQGWATDIVGVGIGIGLYSALFLLVTFLCICVPA